VARHFDLTEAQIGFAPAFNQIALAIGIFLLLPLGDRVSNRRLASWCVAGQFFSLLIMAFASSYAVFLAASTFLGFVTLAPYVIPAYVSKRVPQAQLGEVNGILTTGVVLGILVARSMAGVVGEYFGWQSIYVIATILMALSAVALNRTMQGPALDGADKSNDTPVQNTAKKTGKNSGKDTAIDSGPDSYFKLVKSQFPLTFARPQIMISGIIQGLNFGIFLVVWLAIGLHLPGELGYGVDVVGYLALLAIANLFTTTPLGRWADRVGPTRARLTVTCIQLLAIGSLPFLGHNIWLLIPALLVTNIFGPITDMAGRMLLLSEQPDIRTRLLSVYIVFMFTGGGLASWAGTAAYGYAGWQGSTLLAIALSISVVTLSFLTHIMATGKGKK